jgi:hypothetical protein
MNDDLATALADFLSHKRTLGRKYQTEEAAPRLLAFADCHSTTELCQLTPALLDKFVASRLRTRASSFNTSSGSSAASSTGPSPSSACWCHRAPHLTTTDRSAPALPVRPRHCSAAPRGPTPGAASRHHCCNAGMPARTDG